jgi:hypothetical protein
MDPLAAALAASPELLPHSLELRSETVSLLRLSRSDYERASFLDGRIGGPEKPGRTLPFAQLANAVTAAALPERCYFVFHIGHVGSTLLSRLLGRHPSFFALREPEILRTLALAANSSVATTQLPVFLKLWSRTYDQQARSIVKASSFVSDLATPILARDYAPRALVMGVSPETYLATIFGGANVPKEARMLAPFRLARLNSRLGCDWRIDEMSAGEIVALGWACEAVALAQTAGQFAGRVQVMNFDAFLARPQQQLSAAFAHLGASIGEAEVTNILGGPEMRTYSKAPEYSYDAALRQSVLEQGRAQFGTEIHRGLSWLDRAAKQFPQIGNAVPLFEN